MSDFTYEKAFLPGAGGYDIPIIFHFPPVASRALLVIHGFGSGKESDTALRLGAELAGRGWGFVSLDLPAHGDSPVDGDKLRLANCLDDVAATEAWALSRVAEISYFGSSFGAYVLGLYLGLRPHRGRRAVLRCAAVTMPQLLRAEVSGERQALLDRQGWFVLDEGYGRPLRITREFLADLDAHDLFALGRPDGVDLLLIHGDADEEVPLADARRYAAQLDLPLIKIANAGHRFAGPGQIEQVLAAAMRFLI